MQKNIAAQRAYVLAFDTANDVKKTGDAANITGQVSKDAGTSAATNDVNPTELDATDHPGVYYFDLTQAETNAEEIAISAISVTADIILDPVVVYTRPANFPDLAITAAGVTDADIVAISTDSTAADNLELQYDGTGLTGGTFPAPQSQVGSLSSGSGGLSTVADSVTITTGTATGGSLSDTETLDAVVHTIEDDAGTTDFFYSTNVGTNGVGTGVTWDGYVGNNGDSVSVFAFDFVALAYVQIGSITGKNANTVEQQQFFLTIAMTADNGDVRVRFESTDAVDTNTDRILIEFTNVAAAAFILASGTAQSGSSNTIQLEPGDVSFDDQFRRAKVLLTGGTGPQQEAIITDSDSASDTLTITPAWGINPDSTTIYQIVPAQTHSTIRNGGYDNATVYYKTGGETGTQKGVNGTSTNPSGSEADTYAIMAQENLVKVEIAPGSSFVLPSDSSNKQFSGSQYDLDLNGQEIGSTRFTGSRFVTGVGVATSGRPSFFLCGLDGVTLPPCDGFEIGFFGTLTIGSVGAFTFGSSSEVFNNSLTIDYGVGNNASSFFLTGWSGGTVEIQNAGAGTGSYGFSMTAIGGDLVVNANCSATTTVMLAGNISRNADVAGIVYVEDANVNLVNINAEVDTSISDANLATAAALATVDGVVDAIKLVTDNLPDGGSLNDLAAILIDTGTDIPALINGLNDPTVSAIVDGVWDELQAGHVTANTFGFFLDAAISSISAGSAPTVEQIDAELTDQHGAGPWTAGGAGTGAFAITVTVTDGTDPLENAQVRVTEGANSFVVETDVNGEGVFSLDAATYTASITKFGYSFTPLTRTVTGNEAGTLTDDLEMTADAIILPPSDLSLCRVTGFLEDLNNIVAADAEITFRLFTEDDEAVKSERVVTRRNDIVITTNSSGQIVDSQGNLYVDLQRNDKMTPSGSFYKVFSEDAGLQWVTMTLDTDTFDLKELIT